MLFVGVVYFVHQLILTVLFSDNPLLCSPPSSGTLVTRLSVEKVHSSSLSNGCPDTIALCDLAVSSILFRGFSETTTTFATNNNQSLI